MGSHFLNIIHNHIRHNTLIRLHVNKGRGVKLNIPCRFLHFDESSELLTVYHVDEKKVYQFNISEIDDMVTF